MNQIKPILRKRKIVSLAFQDLNLNILEMGVGGKELTIVTGIHGDETGSFVIINELLKDIKRKKILEKHSVKLKIILGANPIALLNRSRSSFVDEKDLNRVFPGVGNCVTDLIAKALLSEIENSNFVIDLHSFKLTTPLMGILVQADDEELNNKNLDLMNSFNPKQIWQINTIKSDERKFSGSLGEILNSKKICNIAIETNNPEILSDEEIFSCKNSLLNVIKSISDNNFSNKSTAFILDRKMHFALQEGIFSSKKKPFDLVKKGEEIGSITCLRTLTEKKIFSEITGQIMQLKRNMFVQPGDEIFAVGKKIKN